MPTLYESLKRCPDPLARAVLMQCGLPQRHNISIKRLPLRWEHVRLPRRNQDTGLQFPCVDASHCDPVLPTLSVSVYSEILKERVRLAWQPAERPANPELFVVSMYTFRYARAPIDCWLWLGQCKGCGLIYVTTSPT